MQDIEEDDVDRAAGWRCMEVGVDAVREPGRGEGDGFGSGRGRGCAGLLEAANGLRFTVFFDGEVGLL